MLISFRPALTAVSLAFNGLVAAALVFAALAKFNTAVLSFPAVEDGYLAAAAVITAPDSSAPAFSPVEIAVKPAEKITLQYSVFTRGGQRDLLINALYDPQVVSVEHSASGILITARGEGETLLQYLANDGIRNLARITVAR
jgi:hypothetical protein